MPYAWKWAGARSIGTSHIMSDLPCQDYFACCEFKAKAGDVLAAVVSDGAGTASHASAGAKMVCTSFLRQAQAHLANGLDIEDVDADAIMDWMDGIRERIGIYAKRANVTPRSCAATLVAVLAGPRSALAVHVGDGAVVVREEGSSDWVVPSWPFQGEYASTTVFVTDNPAPSVVLTPIPARLDRVALFSDGLERLVLDHTTKMAHGPFFDRFTAPVATSKADGRDEALSKLLRGYLDGPEVCKRTDDDKSLILGVRQ